MANCSASSGLRIAGGREGIQLQNNWVGPGYFSTVGVPLVRGREFDERDTGSSSRVAIISEWVARTTSPDGIRSAGAWVSINLTLKSSGLSAMSAP